VAACALRSVRHLTAPATVTALAANDEPEQPRRRKRGSMAARFGSYKARICCKPGDTQTEVMRSAFAAYVARICSVATQRIPPRLVCAWVPLTRTRSTTKLAHLRCLCRTMGVNSR